MLKALLIDDEPHCIDRMKALLAAHKDSVYLMNSFQTVEEGLQGIQMLHPDLLFLDVQIGDKTGFDLLKALPHPGFQVIFTTAFDRYAVQAFKFSAVDYLLKPVDAGDLAAALQRLPAKTPSGKAADRIGPLMDNLNPANPNKKIIVPTTSELLLIAVADILRCESSVNYTTLYLKDKQKIVVARTLKEYDELLSDYGFFRIHNSHLINLAYVKSYSKGKGGSALLTDGTELEVSTRRKDEFLARLAQL